MYLIETIMAASIVKMLSASTVLQIVKTKESIEYLEEFYGSYVKNHYFAGAANSLLQTPKLSHDL